ncbi:MAG: hypothetical protein IPM66_08740 [Acidobacteriota bacterium]|nr:MAG: hypothetical protein IPM66_08740 [Acidobacteriota bacterium]
MKRFLLMFSLLILAAALPVVAQDGGAVSDLGWLAGDWTCEKWGGRMNETWAPPTGNSMTGMFSHVKSAEPAFYEFMTIEKTAEGLRFYLRHFGPKSVAWEDKQAPMVFSVRLASKHEVVFERIDIPDANTKLVYKLEGPDRLTARLEKTKDGKTQVETFNYVRSK